MFIFQNENAAKCRVLKASDGKTLQIHAKYLYNGCTFDLNLCYFYRGNTLYLDEKKNDNR